MPALARLPHLPSAWRTPRKGFQRGEPLRRLHQPGSVRGETRSIRLFGGSMNFRPIPTRPVAIQRGSPARVQTTSPLSRTARGARSTSSERRVPGPKRTARRLRLRRAGAERFVLAFIRLPLSRPRPAFPIPVRVPLPASLSFNPELPASLPKWRRRCPPSERPPCSTARHSGAVLEPKSGYLRYRSGFRRCRRGRWCVCGRGWLRTGLDPRVLMHGAAGSSGQRIPALRQLVEAIGFPKHFVAVSPVLAWKAPE